MKIESKVFREIGFADELGSSMRNTYKYTKLYSGEDPIFDENDIFKTTLPLTKVVPTQVDVAQDDTALAELILTMITQNNKVSREEMATTASVSKKTIERN